MPHLSPILWVFVVVMFLVSLSILVSCFWWMQLNKFSVLVLKESAMKNNWLW